MYLKFPFPLIIDILLSKAVAIFSLSGELPSDYLLQFEFLFQGCYCERLLTTGANNQSNGTKPGKDGDEKTVKFHCLAFVDIRILQFCFGIMYRRENQRQYELRADTVSECKAWIDAIKMAR